MKDTATSASGAHVSTTRRGRRLPYCLMLTATLLGAAILHKDDGARFPQPKTRSNSQWAQLYASLPMSFEANRGQTDPNVNFLSRGQGYTLFLTGNQAVLTLRNSSSSSRQKPPATSTEALRLQLLGANTHATVSGADELPGKANYFLGNDPKQWRTDIPTYAKVRYHNVYPGVDLVYYGEQGGKLEYDFVVAPGADAGAIALEFAAEGHTALRITPEGDLVVKLHGGEARFQKPVLYQEAQARVRGKTPGIRGLKPSAENRLPVEGHYALDSQNHVHFVVGAYDHHRPLVIDPVLIYATYIGGTGGDIGYAIAVNSTGSIPYEAYIAGYTGSSNFPTTSGAAYTASGGDGDCFVSEINNAGTTLIFSSYLGGSGIDACTALSLSSTGTIFVTGYTASTNFPVKAPTGIGTSLPFQQIYGGGTDDAFITEFAATGDTLVYSTYLGGSGLDEGNGIASDSSGNAYVTGFTQSSNFPVTSGAFQPSLNGSENAFITKMNSEGETLLYSTFLGGSRTDQGQSIQIDNASTPDMYVAGYTFSPDFPTVSPIQPSLGGQANAFVAELNGAGSALTFSTFLGGAEVDEAYGLALDSSNNIYVAGTTTSTNFPTTSGAFQTALNGPEDAFVAKLNAGGASLAYSTYLGGSGTDEGYAIAVSSSGNAFVTGLTESSDFPTANPVQAVLGGSTTSLQDCGATSSGTPIICPDAFVTQLNSTGTALVYSTYLGGSGYDTGQAITLDNTGDPYITGTTVSTNFPVAVPNANVYTPPYKTTLTGSAGNAYFAKIDVADNPQISILPGTVNFGSQTINITSTVQQVYVVNPSTAPLIITNIQANPINGSSTVFQITEPATGGCLGTLPPNGASCYFGVTFTPNAATSQSTSLYFTDNAGGTAGVQQYITLTGTGSTTATSAAVQPSSLSFTNQAIGTTSAAQVVTITNTGTLPLAISSFSLGTSLDFTYVNPTTAGTTNTAPGCESVSNTLAAPNTATPGQYTSCFIYVYFTPTATGTRNATLQITDNASGSPQDVALTGVAVADFTLSSPSGALTLIGDTSTTFTIAASPAVASFNGTISLACSANTTCTFNPTTIFPTNGTGNSTTMTVSNLTSSLPNPYPFVVTGTSGSQSYSLNMTINFEDYQLTISPSSDIVQAGGTATYNIFVNPLFGFNNQAVTLTIYATSPTLPDYTYQLSPTSQPITNGIAPAQVTLTINTAKYTPPTAHLPPFFPKGKLPPIIFGLLTFAGLASLAFGSKRRARQGGWGSVWLGVRMAALSLILAADLALAVSCRASALATAGTVTGNYVLTIQGELVSNNTVNRYAKCDLSVTTTVGTTTTPSPAP